MSMRRLISKDYNEVSGLTTLYWAEGTKVTVQVLQDAEPFVKQNQREYNSISSKGKLNQNDGHGTKVASIPMGLVEQLLKEKGLNIITCSNAELFRLLNSPEYKALRTAPGWL